MKSFFWQKKGVIALLFFPALLVALFAYATEVEPYNIEVTHYQISAPLKSPVKIAHLTDLHTSGIGRRERLMFEILDREKPDLIVITGDQINDSSSYDGCREVLLRLHAPLGVWVVPGNHDNWSPPPNGRAFYDSLGVNYLVNQSKPAREDLWIIGLDDAATRRPDITTATKDVPKDAYKLVLFHSPSYFDVAAGKCDLVLAGHTHGGQVHIPFIKPRWLPRGSRDYLEGWYERNGTKMYVSRGLGTSILPMRFDCRPEIAIITLGAP